MTLVVDTSVAMKWIVREVDSDLAEMLLIRAEPLIAPDLIGCEVANALATKIRLGQVASMQARQALADLENQFDRVYASMPMAPRALEIAESLAHPAYDCFYLALAEIGDAAVITADDRFLRAVSGSAWQDRLLALRDRRARH